MMIKSVNIKRLNELLICDPENGTLVWKQRIDVSKTWNTRYSGTIAAYLEAKTNLHLFQPIPRGNNANL